MTVEIDVTPEPEVEVHDDAPDVVVVDTGDDNSDDLELGIRIGKLESAVEGIAASLAVIAERSVVAEEIAEDAVDAVDDVAEEVAEVVAEALAETEEVEEVEPDNTPNKVHWAHRERHELFKRGD